MDNRNNDVNNQFAYACSTGVGGIQATTMNQQIAMADIQCRREELEVELHGKIASLERDSERKRMMDGHLAGLQYRMMDLEERKRVSQAELSAARQEAEQLRAELQKEKDEQYKQLREYETEMAVLSRKFQAGSVQYNEDAKLSAEMKELAGMSHIIRDKLSRARQQLAEVKYRLDLEQPKQPITVETPVDKVNMMAALQVVCKAMEQTANAEAKTVKKLSKKLSNLLQVDSNLREELDRIEVVLNANNKT